MFWVIFDTSTKRDYYRDVHNLLALPRGSIIRYDYNAQHLSAAALEEASKRDTSTKRVLVAYAQRRSFKKGDPDPRGPIAYEQGLWVGTRIANLAHLQFSVNRYYFDLEVLEYPASNDAALDAIVRTLVGVQDTPFVKWVATCNLDAQFDALTEGMPSNNWASVVNRVGNPPSQFAGDSFWRIAKVATGQMRSSVQPVHREHSDVSGAITAVESVLPIFELDKIAIQIESRLPEAGEESKDNEPETARIVSFETATDGPLAGFNARTIALRRYANDWTDTEVKGSDRLDAQICDLLIKTGPATATYPVGPEFRLRFEVAKKSWRGYLAPIFAILGVIGAIIGAALFKDYPTWGLFLIAAGVILGFFAYYTWSGRVRLPGN